MKRFNSSLTAGLLLAVTAVSISATPAQAYPGKRVVDSIFPQNIFIMPEVLNGNRARRQSGDNPPTSRNVVTATPLTDADMYWLHEAVCHYHTDTGRGTFTATPVVIENCQGNR